MDISLAKLPWYAQVGAFVALSAVGVGMFYYYYELPARADVATREVTLRALRADVAKGQATEKKLPHPAVTCDAPVDVCCVLSNCSFLL